MIYFLGDVHGQIDHVLPALRVRQDTAAHVVFLGDIDSNRPFEEEIRPLIDAGISVWFIHGNHDTDSRENWENLQGSAHRNLSGRVVEIEGVRVAGLGGIFRGEVWHPYSPANIENSPRLRNYDDYINWLKSKTPPRQHASVKNTNNALKHLSTIFPDGYDQLADQRADILVTHEAPSCHPHGFELIDILAQSMGVKLVFHGHHHDSLNYQAWESKLGFRAHGVGYRGITDMQGVRVLAGYFDEARSERTSRSDVKCP
ncbi:MAG: metallophosphoesterase [Pseudohongiella sp.]|nr:metallophosphoesterase [Pseudohongiella sp.]